MRRSEHYPPHQTGRVESRQAAGLEQPGAGGGPVAGGWPAPRGGPPPRQKFIALRTVLGVVSGVTVLHGVWRGAMVSVIRCGFVLRPV